MGNDLVEQIRTAHREGKPYGNLVKALVEEKSYPRENRKVKGILSKTRRIRAERLEKIQEAMDRGASSIREIFGVTGISRNILYNCSKYIDLPIKKRSLKNMSQRKVQIENAISERIKDVDELYFYLQEVYNGRLGRNILRSYMSKFKLVFPPKKNERKKQIEIAIVKGAKSLKELKEYIPDLAIQTLYQYISKFKIKTGFRGGPSGIRKRYSRIDENVCERFTLQEFSDLEGITREGVRRYLIRTNQHKAWKEARRKYSNL